MIGDNPSGQVEFVENGLLFQAMLLKGTRLASSSISATTAARRASWPRAARFGRLRLYRRLLGLCPGRRRALRDCAGCQRAALETLKRNIENNGFSADQVDVIAADAFEGMAALIAAKRKFNLVVVDPPAFANSRASMRNAVLAYRRLVEMALRLLANDGVLVMASCSSRISADMFYQLVTRSAAVAGFELDVLEKTSHALDHPIGFAEAEYLKAILPE